MLTVVFIISRFCILTLIFFKFSMIPKNLNFNIKLYFCNNLFKLCLGLLESWLPQVRHFHCQHHMNLTCMNSSSLLNDLVVVEDNNPNHISLIIFNSHLTKRTYPPPYELALECQKLLYDILCISLIVSYNPLVFSYMWNHQICSHYQGFVTHFRFTAD